MTAAAAWISFVPGINSRRPTDRSAYAAAGPREQTSLGVLSDFQHCPSVSKSLAPTVLISDCLSVFKSRLKTLFNQAFTEHRSDLPPAPLKLRPYGAIEIRLLLLLLLRRKPTSVCPGFQTYFRPQILRFVTFAVSLPYYLILNFT